MINKKRIGCGVTRIDPALQGEIEELLSKNENKIYCNSVPSFIKIAVRELLDRIKENGDKIRLNKNG